MSSIENQYNEQQEQDFAEYLEFKEKRNREFRSSGRRFITRRLGAPINDKVV